MVTLLLHLNVIGAFAQQPFSPNLKRGTNVSVKLTSVAASNKKNPVTAIVAADVIDQTTKQTLIKMGTPVVLSVDQVKAKGMGKGGSISVNAISTTAVDGKTVMLMGSTSKAGDNTGTALTLGLVMGLLVLPGVGFFFFCLKGEKVELPRDTIIPNVMIADDYAIAI